MPNSLTGEECAQQRKRECALPATFPGKIPFRLPGVLYYVVLLNSPLRD